uniref:ribonuclease Z n=2 Tax=Parascaris univalens TaxID=6257 RepID=A0A915B8J9_PARUN
MVTGSYLRKIAAVALFRSTKSLRSLSSRSRYSSSYSEEITEKVYEDLNRRIDKFRKELNKYARASFRSRSAASSLSNLRATLTDMKEKQRKHEAANSIALIPSIVTLEVLSNGTTHLRPSLIIRTPQKVYLFNCPEGTTRFLPSLRVKSLNVCDIFATRGTWDHIGGISSVLLSKEQGAQLTRLHGPVDIKHFLECIRPFTDSDFVLAKYPAPVEERPLDIGSYQDAALTVHYLPLSGLRGAAVNEAHRMDLNRPVKPIQGVDIAYLVELSSPPRRVDPTKLIELRIPSGPLIGRLKNGESVTLEDGRLIKPEDILFSEIAEEQPNTLIVECVDFEAVDSIKNNSLLQKFIVGTEKMNFVVHFTANEVLNSNEYTAWMNSFGPQCLHIILNGSGPVLPHIESIYRNHALLSHLSPNLFPPLLGSQFNGVIGQDDECEKHEGNLIYARPLQRFALRGSLNTEDPITIAVKGADIESRINQSESTRKAIDDFKNECNSTECSNDMPRISFLGTSSAVPSKYRNVSGYLLQLSESSSVMVDCGEGSYGQLRVLFGVERCLEILLSLKAIFITHAHQDHMNGLYTMILRRHEAFLAKGVEYRPLVLVCNFNVLNPLRTYSRCFCDLEPLVNVVNISNRSPAFRNRGDRRNHLRRGDDSRLSGIMDIVKLMPRSLFDRAEWGLTDILAVQVHHTRMANGFVFTDLDGRKIVFSGDTKPCDLLVEHGMNADLLIHEATFEDDHERDAEFKKHSTMKQAVNVGLKMHAKHIILSHFSARYPKVPALPDYLDNAGNVSVAVDNLSVRFGDLALLPKTINVFRELYQDELF